MRAAQRFARSGSLSSETTRNDDAEFKSERAQDWGGQAQMRPERRVEKLAPADFRDGAELWSR